MLQGRRHVTSMSLMLIYAITAFLVTYVLISFTNMNELQLANSGYISAKAVSLEVKEDINISADEIQAQLARGTYLLRQKDNNPEILEFYAIQKGCRFPIVSGTSFQLNDAEQAYTQMMQGREATYMRENQVVVAQLGMDEPSLLDYQTLILPALEQRTVLQRGTWICDGTGNVAQSVQQLCALLGKNCTVVETSQSGLYRMTSMENTFGWILCLVLCCCILACVPLTNHWVDSCHYEQQCYERMGVPAVKQWFCFLKQLIRLSLGVWIVGSVMAVCTLGKSVVTYLPWLILETVVAMVCIAIMHAVIFFTNEPEYPWREKKA